MSVQGKMVNKMLQAQTKWLPQFKQVKVKLWNTVTYPV